MEIGIEYGRRTEQNRIGTNLGSDDLLFFHKVEYKLTNQRSLTLSRNPNPMSTGLIYIYAVQYSILRGHNQLSSASAI